MSKDFNENVRVYGGISLEYSALTEADFIDTAGSAYTPPESGNFRRINVSRCLQLLSDITGVVETFQTSNAEVRLPANTLTDTTNDAGNGRLIFFKNSGTGTITINDYTGTTLWTVKQSAIVIVVGNDNDNWDFYFTAKNIDFDNTSSGLTAENVQDAIDELVQTASVSASPGFTYGRSGSLPNGTYLLNDTVPSNVAGRISTVTGFLKKVFVAQKSATAFNLDIQIRVGAVFTTIHTVNVPAQRTYVDSPASVAVSSGDELCAVVSSTGNPNNVDIGLILKGAL